jgi:hypothetical protein
MTGRERGGMSWQQVAMPEGFNRAWRKANGDDPPPPRAFEHGGCCALVGREPVVAGDYRWHISVSGPGRVPSWEELAAAAHALRPGVPMAVGIPPRSWWVNVHPHTLHLWELRDEHLIAEWRRNARGDRPT